MRKLSRWFKKQFVPHAGNNHQPHFLRIKTALLVFLLVFVFEASFLTQFFLFAPAADFLAAVLPGVLTSYANEDRAALGLNELTTNNQLIVAAQMKANDMAAEGYFAHTSPDGETPWYWLEKAGYAYQSAGENLAVNFTDSRDVQTAWMNSTSHRANIISPKYTEIGIATAEGTYQGRPAIFVAQFFGRPRIAYTPPTETARPVAEVVPVPDVLGEVNESVNETSIDIAINEPLAQNFGDSNQQVSPESSVATNPQPASSYLTRILTNPRLILSILFGLLLAIIAIAILLKIFVKIKVQYPLLIANGAMLFLAVAGALYLNDFLFSDLFKVVVI